MNIMSEKVIKNSQLDHYFSTLPPQNLEAEESVLGGILLDENAMERVVDILTPEAFYIRAHQEIYRAALTLYKQGGLTDFMTVTDWLYEHKLLDKVGGQSKIAQLIERTVSAVNIDRHAMLVMDKFLKRQLIQTGNEIAHLAGDPFNPTDKTVEIARNKLEGLLVLPGKQKEREYNSLMEKAEKIILYEDNPGKRLWELQRLAKRHGLSASKLEEIYYKHLLHKDSTPSMTWDELIKHESDSPDWVYHGFMLRGSLTLLYSSPGVGKTLFFYFLAFCAAAGISWKTKIGEFSATAKRRRILFVQADETRPEMIRSLRRLGFDAALDLDCRYLTDWNVTEIPKLIREIHNFKPDAIIIDSLSSVGDWTVEENNTRFAVPVNMLRRLAGLFNCWIGLTHHANAEGGLRGTTAIAASASTVVKLERIQGQPLSSSQRKLIFQKNRAGTPWSAHCRVNFESGEWEILEGVEGTQLQAVGVQDKIYSFLKENSPKRYETREMAEILAQAQPSVRRTCNQLSGLGLISKVQLNRKCLYFVQRDKDKWDDAPDSGSDHGDHSDHSDPEAITGDGSHPNSFQQVDPASSDHAIAQNQNSNEQFENEKIDDRMIASAETTQNQEVECDHPHRIASGSHPDRIAIEDYRGLTIKQPHAQRFSQGLKRYEVRGRKTNYRGLILIHSSKEYEKGFNMDRTLAGVEYPTGKILAVAELTDCIKITEALINEQPEDELFGGYWQPGRWAWKLENIRPVYPLPSAAGNFMLWQPTIDHLDGVEIGERVDTENSGYTCVQDCLDDLVKYAESRDEAEQVIGWYSIMSDRQRAEVYRRVTVAVTDEPAQPISIFDQIQVGDLVCRSTPNGTLGSKGMVIRKIMRPKRVEIRWGDNVKTLSPEDLEILRIKLTLTLKPGLRVKLGNWYGTLAAKSKGGWFVNWDKLGKTLIKKYGEPPKSAIAPQDLEVIE